MLRIAASALLICGAATAQGTVWIVDRAGGPGSNFTDLIAAEAAASAGDTLRVRAGSYTGFATSKGLTVLGEGLVVIEPSSASTSAPAIRVTGLPAGQRFVLDGVRVEVRGGFPIFGGSGSFVFENCFGTVHLENVDVGFDGQPGDGIGMDIVACSAVSLTDCDVVGRPGILASAAAFVTVVDSRVDGGVACGAALCGAVAAAPGIYADRASVELIRTRVRGGAGASVFGSTIIRQGSPAVLLARGSAVIGGDATTAILAGASPNGIAIDAIAAIGNGSVTLDPAVTVLGHSGGNPVGVGVILTMRGIPTLVASGGAPGGTVSFELRAPAQSLAVLVLSRPIAPISTPFGALVFDTFVSTPLFSGVVPVGGQTQSLSIPLDTSLDGQVFTMQAGVADPMTLALELTNGAVFVLH